MWGPLISFSIIRPSAGLLSDLRFFIRSFACLCASVFGFGFGLAFVLAVTLAVALGFVYLTQFALTFLKSDTYIPKALAICLSDLPKLGSLLFP
jgi:hypothetical protein